MAAQIVGDIIFGEPARYLAGLHAAHGQPTYLYRFDVISPSVAGRWKGTAHAQERQYVFDTLHASPFPTDANDQVQALHAVTYWTNFAKAGDPNGGGEPAWPRYTLATDRLLGGTSGPWAGFTASGRWDGRAATIESCASTIAPETSCKDRSALADIHGATLRVAAAV
jgi:para-nitrobenzyl esterase